MVKIAKASFKGTTFYLNEIDFGEALVITEAGGGSIRCGYSYVEGFSDYDTDADGIIVVLEEVHQKIKDDELIVIEDLFKIGEEHNLVFDDVDVNTIDGEDAESEGVYIIPNSNTLVFIPTGSQEVRIKYDLLDEETSLLLTEEDANFLKEASAKGDKVIDFQARDGYEFD